jgi:hypothetical protein
MVEVCYGRMTEILSCREFCEHWERGSVEKANFISCKTLRVLPNVVVDMLRRANRRCAGNVSSCFTNASQQFLKCRGSNLLRDGGGETQGCGRGVSLEINPSFILL